MGQKKKADTNFPQKEGMPLGMEEGYLGVDAEPQATEAYVLQLLGYVVVLLPPTRMFTTWLGSGV